MRYLHERRCTTALDVLVSPLAAGAFFDACHDVVEAEVRAVLGDVVRGRRTVGGLTFLRVDTSDDAVPALARLSGVQGVFEPVGDALRPLPADPGFGLPAELVWGAKYRGKTHELVTQLALNLALAACRAEPEDAHRVLDPMAGRGTTLLWAARYGMEAWGVEFDPAARDDFQRHVKRQTQLHRIKHRLERGSVGPTRRDGRGAFVAFRFGDVRAQLVTGDSRNLRELLGPRPFSLIVTDVPYGVQHLGRGGTRNPLAVLEACAPAWVEALCPGGAMAVVFNRLQPRRAELERVFLEQGVELVPVEVAHRMSESIWRDVLVARRSLTS